jgi:hypothetical protein
MSSPGFSFNVKRVNIAVGNSLVVKTTVTSIDVDLAIVVASGGVGSWGWCADGRLLVVDALFVAEHAGPGEVTDLEPPAVVESLVGSSVATEDENAIKLGGGNSDVLSSGWWEVISLGFFFLPTAFL